MNNRFEGRPRFGNNNRDRQQFTPPVSVDEELDVKIEAVGEKGDGVAKKNGFVLFVPGVKEGDYVRVKVTRVLKKVGFAEVVGSAKSPEPEAQRVEEPVPKEEPEEVFEPSEDDSEDFGEDDSSDDEELDVPKELDDSSDDEDDLPFDDEDKN
jgi:predicted RNA-binding protein with TRAM domain